VLTNRSLRRQIVAYVVLLAVAMLILAFSSSPPVTQLRRGVGYAMAPIQEVLRGAGQTVGSVFSAFGEIERLRLQNEDLTRRLDRRVSEATQMPVHVADDPLTCVVRGTGKALEDIDVMERTLVSETYSHAPR